MGGKAIKSPFDVTIYKERRAAILQEMPKNSALLLFAASEKTRNSHTHFRYRQTSDLLYLTGLQEPGSALLLCKHAIKKSSHVFVREKNPAMEQWDGRRLGVKSAARFLGVTESIPIKALEKSLPQLLDGTEFLYFDFGKNHGNDRIVSRVLSSMRSREKRGVVSPTHIVDPRTVIHAQRQIKSSAEIRKMSESAKVAAKAHAIAMSMVEPGMFEYELQAGIEFVFAQSGAAAPAYTSIVGGGANATILHYIENNCKLKNGELVLIDAGCELDGYASDITRTFPVNGKFTPPQKDMYQAVLAAQQASFNQIKVGATLEDVHQAAIRSLCESLIEMGIVKGSVDEAIEKKKYSPYYMHGTSHWLGMDVHDVGPYRVNKTPTKLEAGMVFTVEPGLYFQASQKDVPRELRDHGIRIEDDIVVQKRGYKILTEDAPKTVKEIEAQCRKRPKWN